MEFGPGRHGGTYQHHSTMALDVHQLRGSFSGEKLEAWEPLGAGKVQPVARCRCDAGCVFGTVTLGGPHLSPNWRYENGHFWGQVPPRPQLPLSLPPDLFYPFTLGLMLSRLSVQFDVRYCLISCDKPNSTSTGHSKPRLSWQAKDTDHCHRPDCAGGKCWLGIKKREFSLKKMFFFSEQIQLIVLRLIRGGFLVDN